MVYDDAGLRLSEGCALRREDVDPTGYVRVLGKGDEEDIVPVEDSVVESIGQWVATQDTDFEVPRVSGGPGFWLNRSTKVLPGRALDAWAVVIDGLSEWLVIEASEVFPDVTSSVDYADLQEILAGATGQDMTTQFLRHYTALRLNLLTGVTRPSDVVDVSSADPDGVVFSHPTATVGDIVQTIEGGAFFTDEGPGSDERARLEIMKDVYEMVNAEA